MKLSDIKELDPYRDTKDGFTLFHNEIFNLPRDTFSDKNANTFARNSIYLSSVIHLLDPSKPVTNKELLLKMREANLEGKYNDSSFRDKNFENTYLNFCPNNIDNFYDKIGRNFRHIMEFNELFSLILKKSKHSFVINESKVKSYNKLSDNNLLEQVRSELLGLDFMNNDLIKGLRTGHAPSNKTGFYPIVHAILSYINSMNRSVSDFEIAILFGRFGGLYEESSILSRALKIGHKFYSSNREEQKNEFFRAMNWNFNYKSSQQPWFKFGQLINLLTETGLIEKDVSNDHAYRVTRYAIDLLKDDNMYFITDLSSFTERLANEAVSDSVINTYLSSHRIEIENLNKNIPDFKYQISLRSLKKERNAIKRSRNRVTALVSKILNSNKAAVSWYPSEANHFGKTIYNKELFQDENGIGYTEGHHLLELNPEKGPDILENLIQVDPNTHMFFHHASKRLVREMYALLRRDGIIDVNRFYDMTNKYHALSMQHIRILLDKQVIYADEAEKLKRLVTKNGYDGS